MREISLPIPTLEADQNIEIEVQINGKKRTLRYRVEIVSWEGEAADSRQRIEVLKRVIKSHEKDWKLIQIGAPSGDKIPVMFRKKSS